jgi:protein gp37
MASTTKISWADATWNPWIGCTHVSPGCDNCYAATWARRFKRRFDQVQRTAQWDAPIKWHKRGKLPADSWIFVCSLSDFFHQDVPDNIRDVAISIMESTPYNYLILTKRVFAMAAYLERRRRCGFLPLHPNIHLGFTAENRVMFANRFARFLDMAHLQEINPFISFEPLLDDVNINTFYDLDPKRISGIIVGGETGPGARPMDPYWALKLRVYAKIHNIPFTFKQHSTANGKRDHKLNGVTYNQFPPRSK